MIIMIIIIIIITTKPQGRCFAIWQNSRVIRRTKCKMGGISIGASTKGKTTNKRSGEGCQDEQTQNMGGAFKKVKVIHFYGGGRDNKEDI